MSVPRASAMVTVVPFRFATPSSPGHILLSAEVDGRRGTFLLDTGSPLIMLNSRYLQADGFGGFDTNTTGSPQAGRFPVNVHTLRLGTFLYHFDSTHVESPAQEKGTNALLSDDEHFYGNALGQPVLGFLGLPAWAPFELIIDYVHQQLILIRVDSAGRRLAAVPQFVPAQTVELVPITVQVDSGQVPQWYGADVMVNGVHVPMLLDTGAPQNDLTPETLSRLETHLVPHDSGWRVDRMLVGNHVYAQVQFSRYDTDILGYPFLSQRGVVGFNLRAHRLIFYQAPALLSASHSTSALSMATSSVGSLASRQP